MIISYLGNNLPGVLPKTKHTRLRTTLGHVTDTIYM